MDLDFQKWPKIPRLKRDIIITEKLDGTNAQVYNMVIPRLTEHMQNDFDRKGWRIFRFEYGNIAVIPASRNRYITVGKKDNYEFAGWVNKNAAALAGLGIGRHYGEWWGEGINRGYGMDHREFSLFNTSMWSEKRPTCCSVVPTLYTGKFDTDEINDQLNRLKYGSGSVAAPGYYSPEGIVVFHTASNSTFKVTLEGDESPKGLIND